MTATDPFHLTGRPVVIGTGLLALDVVFSADDATPPRIYAGGTCGNVLVILSYFGWESYPIARLNGDTASRYVVKDLKQWAVQLDLAMTKPGCNTPIVVQRIKRKTDGKVSHHFTWTCPTCGAWLPSYAAVHTRAAQAVIEARRKPNVFFFDRVSRGAITLAKASAQNGALVVFEPSSVGDPLLFQEAISCAHILKYSYERIHNIPGLCSTKRPLLEIQTLGSDGVRYRHHSTNPELKEWITIPASHCSAIRDTAGAGDWFSAGIIHYLGQNGFDGLLSATREQIVDALRFGQALSAWNCTFEGARGGMYLVDKKSFRTNVREALSGREVIIVMGQRRHDRALHNWQCLSPCCSAKKRT
jgi:sugar/nucleoside kinase (ribokinase family)